MKVYSRKIQLLIAVLISVLPYSCLRVLSYRLILGYQIAKGARIGFMAVIAVDTFSCGEGVLIGRATTFKGPMAVFIGAHSMIGRWNEFECSPVAALSSKAHMKYARKLVIGNDCLIHEHHYFDVYGEINIGNETWIAGRGTQFWTHGASAENRDIHIGEKCYVGSACRFAPGGGVSSGVVVGIGSVITKSIDVPNTIVAGVPAKPIKKRDESGDGLVFERWGES